MTELRDLNREREFLTAAGGEDAFVQQATQRLHAGDALHGDSWATRGIASLIGELLEEAADLGSWSALADQAVDEAPVRPGERQRLSAVLALVARHGAQAHALLSAATPARPAGARRDFPVCGAPRHSAGGLPCQKPAGWGTPGRIGVCRLHGGMLPGVRQAVAVAEARAHVASLVGPVDIEPHDALQLALALTAAEVNYFSARIAELGNDEVAGQATITKTRAGASGDGDGDDKAPAVVETRQLAPSLHLWVKARSDALERLARFSKMALDANVDERRVRVQEVQLDRLAGVVNAVMRDLQAAGLSAELRSLAGDSCAGQTPTTQDRPARRLRLLRLERCCPTGAVRAAPARIRRVGRATPRPN